MLKAQYLEDNKKYVSWNNEDYKFILDNRNQFICPHCKGKVIFVDGTEVIKHFRHFVLSDCDFEPETQNHLEMKMFMKNFFNLTDEDVEVDLGFAKPDLLKRDQKIAIEVQNSNITKKKFLERCYNYTQNGYAVLWVFHEDLLKEYKETSNIPILLRTAHEHYFERVYIYSKGKIIPIHFNPIKRYVEEYTDYETGETFGGYIILYKKKKLISVGEDIPEPMYGKELYKCHSKFSHNTPSGYYIAKFYDVL